MTLSLSEYNRLVELASRKDKTPDGVPLPFVLSHAVFKLRVEKQTLVGTVDIDGALLAYGTGKDSSYNRLNDSRSEASRAAMPLLQEGSSHSAILIQQVRLRSHSASRRL